MAYIEIKTGDIVKANAEALINTVNCVGVMGRGLSLQFKKAFPANFRAYALACKDGEMKPGKMFVYDTRSFTNPRYIINFPTKRHWKAKSRMEDIDSGLLALVREVSRRDIKSVAIPPLGAGLGGLDWDDVRPRIEAAFRDLTEIKVSIYEPNGAPEFVKSRNVPSMTPGRAALVVLMDRYLQGLMDPFVTLIEVHKLMYFMQEAGQPLRLNYVKHHYGPYAKNLSHVLNEVEGHFVAGYRDGGDQPDKELMIVPGAISQAEAALEPEEAAQMHFNKVADLVDGFETPFGLELLATVHWVVTREGADTHEKAVAGVWGWNDRKKIFTQRQIVIAFDILEAKGWFSAR
ncbi:macro domain-containing protein [Jiella sp. MQZ9-1]|uniref:Macro domain-containing protein n=1 Tax=Jiella flava TaxID=2816857 RepID=A0A939JU54_9HYPH|nr:macro domain-containing protein [Jiella flava]MBO0661069.1 macro domain-containing protein [Jiella flava]MCD2469716.1 macro domain-containing protein [Jiella flava]